MTEEQLINLKDEYTNTLSTFAKDYSIYREQEDEEVSYYILTGSKLLFVTGYMMNDAQMREIDEHLQATFTINKKEG